MSKENFFKARILRLSKMKLYRPKQCVFLVSDRAKLLSRDLIMVNKNSKSNV